MGLAPHERVMVIGAAILLLLAGLYSFTLLDIEAYPDPVQPMTEILTLPSEYSAEEVERLITVPAEYAMSGMLHLKR
jgi:heavy metal efflux system protein